jgi:protein O-GlcNAc transferase
VAKKAVALEPAEGAYWNTLGEAYYHLGHWKESVQALEKSVSLRKGGNSEDYFFLAMAHWQLSHKDEAKKWYAKGVAWMEKHQPKDRELLRYRAEAAKLLGVK